MCGRLPSDRQILDQARQNLILDALGEVRIRFVFAPVFKAKLRWIFHLLMAQGRQRKRVGKRRGRQDRSRQSE